MSTKRVLVALFIALLILTVTTQTSAVTEETNSGGKTFFDALQQFIRSIVRSQPLVGMAGENPNYPHLMTEHPNPLPLATLRPEHPRLQTTAS